MNIPTIGVVGGAGPLAGAKFVETLYQLSGAGSDQENPSVLLWSKPADLPDRTRYLLGESSCNPARSIVRQLKELKRAGATVAGMPCITAHAPRIWSLVQEQKPSLELVSLNRELKAAVVEAGIKNVGVLSTLGTFHIGLFPQLFKETGVTVTEIDSEAERVELHEAIYQVKSGLFQPGDRSSETVLTAIHRLKNLGAEAVILGCTELPLMVPDSGEISAVELIDPLKVLARALLKVHDRQACEFRCSLHKACTAICK